MADPKRDEYIRIKTIADQRKRRWEMPNLRWVGNVETFSPPVGRHCQLCTVIPTTKVYNDGSGLTYCLDCLKSNGPSMFGTVVVYNMRLYDSFHEAETLASSDPDAAAYVDYIDRIFKIRESPGNSSAGDAQKFP